MITQSNTTTCSCEHCLNIFFKYSWEMYEYLGLFFILSLGGNTLHVFAAGLKVKIIKDNLQGKLEKK